AQKRRVAPRKIGPSLGGAQATLGDALKDKLGAISVAPNPEDAPADAEETTAEATEAADAPTEAADAEEPAAEAEEAPADAEKPQD
ncbi:MAG: hypothetical protein JRF42_17455, partial [Deltaproteobacteria bacterium]|nr:hypothetical protein [Deltaproteobacteria bacterium]